MKLLNILGAVVVIHIAVLVLAVAIPGCRSTPKKSTSVGQVSDGSAYGSTSKGSPVSAAPDLMDRDLNPPLAYSSSATFDPNAPAVSNATAAGRYSPTRPSSTVGTTLTATNLPDANLPEVDPVFTYTVKSGDNLWALAKKNGISVRELASANDLAPDSGLRPGQVLVIPGGTPSTATRIATTAPSGDFTSYTIRPGDTLDKIARANGSTVSKLKAFNKLSSDLVRAGDLLSIPVSDAPPTAPETNAAPTVATTVSSSTGSGAKNDFKHVVAAGESLTTIAQKYGVKMGDIALANQIRNPRLIRPGQELMIPGWDATATTPAKRASTPAAAIILRDDQDLDTGLEDTSLDDVPVIQVEDPITTISTGGGANSGPSVFN
jgi:LysM repeat protein